MMQSQLAGSYQAVPTYLHVNSQRPHHGIGEIWQKIWDTLMLYLDAEDSPFKLKQKDQLVELMTVFLSRVTHERKFYLSSTLHVLRATAELETGFRPLSTAQAFETMHQYAVRLIAQPWRKEFASINMYSGYYVHTVSGSLVDSDRLLREMGFSVDGRTRVATLTSMDVDQLTKAAIDTLMASVECRMVQQVLDSLPADSFSARGVMSYRMSYVGDVATAVHQLGVNCRQRQFQHYFDKNSDRSNGSGCLSPSTIPTVAGLPSVPTGRLVDLDEPPTAYGLPSASTIHSNGNANHAAKSTAGTAALLGSSVVSIANTLLPTTLDDLRCSTGGNDVMLNSQALAPARRTVSVRPKHSNSTFYAPMPPEVAVSTPNGSGTAAEDALLRRFDAMAVRDTLGRSPAGGGSTMKPQPSSSRRQRFSPSEAIEEKLSARSSGGGRVSPSSATLPAPSSSRRRVTTSSSDRGAVVSPAAGEVGDGGRSERSWSCHACTFINSPSDAICTMCGKTRVRGAADPVEARMPAAVNEVAAEQARRLPQEADRDEDDVVCGTCTLLNARRARRCGACDTLLL